MKIHVISRAIPIFFLLIISILINQSNQQQEKDYYKILQISRNSNQKQIKKAYRLMTKKYHPDHHDGEEFYAQKYTEINQAYEVLIDKDKRRVYDTQGVKGVKQYEQQKNQAGAGGGGGFFNSFFQDAGQFQQRTGPKMRVKLRVSLEDIYNGREMKITYNRQRICPHCRGSGADDPSFYLTCNKCGGKGYTIQRVQIMHGWYQNEEQTCHTCNGKGKIIKKHCHLCHGNLTVETLENIVVYIERGIGSQNPIVYPEASNEHPDQKAGQLTFEVVALDHPIFQRKGNDLYMEMTLSLKQALIGFRRTIKHLDGQDLVIEKSGRTYNQDDQIKISDRGMPHYGDSSRYGNLYININVDYNSVSLDSQQLQKFNSVFKN